MRFALVVFALLHTSLALEVGSECSCDDETISPSPSPAISISEEKEVYTVPGNGQEGPASCVCKRARKPAAPVRCRKPGSELDTESPQDDNCKEEISLEPIVGSPAIRVLIKIGVNPSSSLSVRDWYTVWTTSTLYTMSFGTGLDRQFMSIIDVTNHPLAFEVQLAVKNAEAAEIVVKALNAAIDNKSFAELFQKQGYPRPSRFKILSVRVFQIANYDPAILQIWFNPSSTAIPVPSNHTHHNRTTHRVIHHHSNHTGNQTVDVTVEEVVEDQDNGILNKLIPVVKSEDMSNETPIQIPGISVTDTRCGRPKTPPRLVVPPLARAHLTGKEFGEGDVPSQPIIDQSQQTGTVVQSLNSPPVYTDYRYRNEMLELRDKMKELQQKEMQLNALIADLTWELEHSA